MIRRYGRPGGGLCAKHAVPPVECKLANINRALMVNGQATVLWLGTARISAALWIVISNNVGQDRSWADIGIAEQLHRGELGLLDH
jgi:hypothetical protein